jgi:DNA recombination protein RmuC
VDRLGRSLTASVLAYNQAVGSLENRVLVTARRLSDLGIVGAELSAPATVQNTTRPLSAPELVTGAEPATATELAPATELVSRP